MCHEEQIDAMHGHVLLKFFWLSDRSALLQVQRRLQHDDEIITKIVANPPKHPSPLAVQLLGFVEVHAVMAAQGLSSGRIPAAEGAKLQLLKAEACTNAVRTVSEAAYTQ